jgi:pimeloyl-ACP methyl ester carboxylesterase
MQKRWWLALPLLAGMVFLLDWNSTESTPHVAERFQAGDVFLRGVRSGESDTTLLLLHGYAESLMAYRPMFDGLAARTRVVAVDLPGFGLSDKPTGSYHLEAYVDRMSAFIDQHIPGPVVVVGHSMGGEVAAALAIHRPDRIVGVVLIASAGYGLSSTATVITRDGAEVLGWVNAAVGELVVPLHDPAWMTEPEEWRGYDPLLDPAFRSASAQVLREFDFAALRTRFHEIGQPTLIIWGNRDPTIPLAYGEAMAEAIDCSRMIPISRTLHRPHQTEPGLVTDAILQFLDDPPACRSNRDGQEPEELE